LFPHGFVDPRKWFHSRLSRVGRCGRPTGEVEEILATKSGGPTGGEETAETVDRSFPRHAAAEMGVKIACLAPVGALR
jgi:hypothetical protein